MNFAEDIALILIVCAIIYPLCAIFFVPAHFYKKKTQRGSGCTVFLKATVIEPLRIRIKHSYHYFMIVYGLRLSKKHRHRFGLSSGAEEDRN